MEVLLQWVVLQGSAVVVGAESQPDKYYSERSSCSGELITHATFTLRFLHGDVPSD